MISVGKNAYILLSVALFPGLATAGTFRSSNNLSFSSGIIVHPGDYLGTGGPIEVTICVAPSAESFRSEVLRAVETWNQLDKTTGNCSGCVLYEEPAPPSAPDIAFSSALHELGHCAFGLGHPNLEPQGQSFTATREFTSITAGADAIRGSRDDVVTPLPGARLLHWFRIADNNPFLVDTITIDQSTFSRQIIQLPSGHLWPASGNRAVGELLGFPSSQAVMYGLIMPGHQYSGLTADDVNTASFARNGLDLTAATADDYSVQLTLSDDCVNADIVAVQTLLPSNIAAACSGALLQEIPTTGTHYRMTGQQNLEFNSTLTWDVVFGDTFETGGTSRWSATAP